REALLKPRLPQWRLVGDGCGRLIAVKVEVQRDHARAATVKGAEGGDARPRLVEPQQGVVRTLGVVLCHAAEGRHARGRRPPLPPPPPFPPPPPGHPIPGPPLRFPPQGPRIA